MLETHLISPDTRRRLFSGAASDHIDAFADWLSLHGYRPISIRFLLGFLANWTDWVPTAGFTKDSLLQAFDISKSLIGSERELPARQPNQKAVAAAATFIRFLRERGDLPHAVNTPPASERWPILGEFREWMRDHRGLRETTLDLYEYTLVGLLEVLGDDAGNYSAERVRAFVLHRARPHGISRANAICIATRSFCRFLGVTGRCPTGLEYAIPGFSTRRHHSSVPKFLVHDDVERLLNSCTTEDVGIRDKAVLLLLARLGLRASEVALLKFTDISWQNGTIAVSGKGRRQELLPLPQEVGDAILVYIQTVRPSLQVPEVFISVLAPLRPLTRAAVTHIVRRALSRTGIKAPINGAHVLRHSAATAMLQKGASLAGVSAILRHRSPMITTHYAKVDFALLSEIAQPWTEAPSC